MSLLVFCPPFSCSQDVFYLYIHPVTNHLSILKASKASYGLVESFLRRLPESLEDLINLNLVGHDSSSSLHEVQGNRYAFPVREASMND